MQTQILNFTQDQTSPADQKPALLTKQERHQLLLQILKTSQKRPSIFQRIKLSFSTKAHWKPTKNTGKSGVSFNHTQ